MKADVVSQISLSRLRCHANGVIVQSNALRKAGKILASNVPHLHSFAFGLTYRVILVCLPDIETMCFTYKGSNVPLFSELLVNMRLALPASIENLYIMGTRPNVYMMTKNDPNIRLERYTSNDRRAPLGLDLRPFPYGLE
jgi:hypothetical protein